MLDERRRYFRINERVGIAYQMLSTGSALSGDGPEASFLVRESNSKFAGILNEIEALDEAIEHELGELTESHPAVVKLVSLFNQKLERVISHIVLDNQLISRLARRLKEANISACGIAFVNDETVDVGTSLKMELTLYPDEQTLLTRGRVVACEPELEGAGYYWRVDFFGMEKADQETLIQHVVRSQSQQLKNKLKV
ncbi:PilZ domain-containing protein [Alteromonadaceae bacterium 2753L.S.0a.02]|nr:PilZ domain-containing protein [Alteromonadaceae bacterium 2753L.S.0a.02]